MTYIFFPMSVFNHGVDEHFTAERDAAKAAGFDVAYVGFDFDEPRSPCLTDAPTKPIYRGWMMRVEQYRDFAHDCGEWSGLLVDNYNYNNAHWFPYWYDEFRMFTPRSIWMPNPVDLESVAWAVRRNFAGKVMVKDYVKASRLEGNLSCDSRDPVVIYDWLKRFVDERDGSPEGGLVVREWENLSPYQFRVWFMNGKPTFVSPHQCDITSTPSPLQFEYMPVIDSPFYCVDVALGDRGDWRVIEVGDGGVSSVSESHMADFYATLHREFT